MTVNREKSIDIETFWEMVGNFTLQDTKKGFSAFQFLCMAKYSLSPYSSCVTGLEAILCTLILSGRGFRHLSTFSCVSILPQDVRNVIYIWTHPIHSEQQKCALPFLQQQRHFSRTSFQDLLWTFTVKEEHQNSCTYQICLFPFLMSRVSVGGFHSFMAFINHLDYLRIHIKSNLGFVEGSLLYHI